MSGNVKQFVDFSNNTNNDTGENTATSILPIVNGEGIDQTVLQRPSESLRQRTEALKNVEGDSLYLRDADRALILAGPGTVTWPGSTTAGQTGVPTLNDTLYLVPMLTPGFPQTAPVPPVASKFGVIHLKRVTGSLDSIAVTSMRHSYAAGDQISIVVTPGAVFSCTLDTETGYQRTIKIVATNTTQLSTVITALNGLLPAAPDNTQLVSAALENGALGTDLILTSQAKQFMSGNYDGEGHAIVPANLQAFFTANPTSALAEGDTLAIYYPMVSDTASTGGRRQSIPENSNTAVPFGAFFNSRVNPEKLVNAIPVCKVINGALVFGTGVEIPPGSTNVSLSTEDLGSRIIRNPGFEHGVTLSSVRHAISDWEIRTDLAVNGAFRLNTTSPLSGGKQLEFNQTAVGAATGRIEQIQEIPVVPGQNIRVAVSVKQLIAPTAGQYSVILYWGDANSIASGSTTIALQVLASTDSSYRTVTQSIQVPAAKRFLKYVTIEVAGVTLGSTGVSLLVDDLQVLVETLTGMTPAVDNTKARPHLMDAAILEDPSTYQLGQLATLLRMDKSTPASEGRLIGERKDQDYTGGNLPPALAWFGRLLQLGSGLLGTEANALKPRISADISAVAGVDYTLLWESALAGESPGTYTQSPMRIYASNNGRLVLANNAKYNGTSWDADINGNEAFRVVLSNTTSFQWVASGVGNWLESAWTTLSRLGVSGSGFLEATNVNVVPATNNDRTVGSSTKQFQQMWSRAMRIGPDIVDDSSKLVQYKSSFNWPTQTNQVDFDYVSAYFGVLTRNGHRFVQDWDGGTATPGGWTTSSTGGAAGSNTLSGTQHRTTVAHNGANVGTFTLQTLSSVKFRLTDGFVCRVRCNNGLGADFTTPYIGFYDVGGAGNGITFGPRTVDGGGSHNYQFAVGAGNTLVGGPGDHAFSANQRWLTFALVGNTLWWNVDALTPDGAPSPSDSFGTAGSATITVPTGLFHFVITAASGGGGFGSSTTVDYVEIITGSRDG